MNNNRPIFSAAWAASTKIYNAQYSAQNVAEIIGGRVAMNIAPNGKWENTCAVRMSYILNKSGFPIPERSMPSGIAPTCNFKQYDPLLSC